MEIIRDFLNTSLGIDVEAQHKIFLSLAILFVLSITRLLLLRILWKSFKSVKARYNWKRSLSMVFYFLGFILIGSLWLPAFEQFGAFLGLFTAGLAIALKDPLTNLAGWLFIVFRKPFIVGDRIQIGTHAGDVVDIRPFQFTILEIRNWVDADQSTGRMIHLPNAKVFLEAQANYSIGFNYIWNEIAVRLTFESNWEKAKTILQEIVDSRAERLSKNAEKEIFEASRNFMIYYQHTTPIVYTYVKKFGVVLTIRYLCDPRQRRGTENEMWQDILTRFKLHNDIHFAYPTTRFYQSGKDFSGK